MELPWKQFGAWAIASKHNVFLWARLKLTGVYVLILAIILVGFSLILFQSLGRNLLNANEEDFAGHDFHQRFVTETLETVRDDIIFIDIIILIISSGISYILAGYSLRPIQNSLEAQKKFSENASHELRTPLAVIKNDIEVLLRNPHPTKENIEKTLTSSVEEIDHMAKLAEDLLAIARSENKHDDVVRINISQVAFDLIGKMRPIAEHKGVALKLSSNTAAYVQGHKTSLARVLMNLIQNAIEHTPKGGAVTIDFKRENIYHVITISDTGKGIDQKDLPRIFERFYKGTNATGSGLGLAIVKELIEKHNGSVEISSIKDKGTVVTIKLPIA